MAQAARKSQLSNNESKTLALERLALWKQKGARLLFSFTSPQSRFSIEVSVLSIHDSQVNFQWILNAIDAQGAFVITNGHYQVLREHASFSVDADSESSVTISHGEFRVVLTVASPDRFLGEKWTNNFPMN